MSRQSTLALTRRSGESVVINVPGAKPIEIEFRKCLRGSCKAVFRASSDVVILRPELIAKMRPESRGPN